MMREQPNSLPPYVVSAGGNRGPNTLHLLKATGADNGGELTVFEGTVGARSATAPLGAREFEDQAHYILEGTMSYILGDDRFDAGPGAFVWIPRGCRHAMGNRTDERVRFLGICTPAGIERFFTEQKAYLDALPGTPSREKVTAPQSALEDLRLADAGQPSDVMNLAYIAQRDTGWKMMGPPLDVWSSEIEVMKFPGARNG